jgi:hypothetical protein
VIDLRAQWWGNWLTPLLTLALGFAVSELGGWLVRRSGARRLETLRYKHWGKQSQLAAGTDATAVTFQRTLLLLSAFATLAFAFGASGTSGMFLLLFCVAASVMLSLALREQQTRGERFFQSPVVLAFALGLALAILIGVIAQIVLGHFVNEYIQVH